MQKKKKILLVVPMLHQGGFERVCADTVHLLKDEYELYVVVFNSEDMIYDVSGAEFIDLKLGALNGKLGKVFQLFRRALRLTRLQRRLNIDICYSFGETANLANALCLGKSRKIVSCHSFEEIKNGFKMKLVLKRADRVICCAKAMKQEISQRYGMNGDKVVAVWNPCDIEGVREKGKAEIPQEYKEFFGKGDKIIISMGREDDVKGFWHLLKSFKHINEVIPNTKLVIVGEGGFGEYKEMSVQMGISDRILFTGVHKNPFPFLAASNIYVLSSLSEGLPNALVEALALELPMVSVNCKSGPAEILNREWENISTDVEYICADYGILTPTLSYGKNTECEWEEDKIKLEKSEEELSNAIIKMLEDEKLYQKYKSALLIRALEFSGEKYKENIINIIEGLV